MAGISQKARPDEVMPLLSHAIYQNGYRGGVTPTEFLKLIERYVGQARELQALAGSSNTIRIENCAAAPRLLEILGYRFRHGCGGQDTALETANPERAFSTIDSGFPITDLEDALGKGLPFVYPYASSSIPVLFRESDWTALSAGQKIPSHTTLDTLLYDPAIARLYWALSKSDVQTAQQLQRSIGLRTLLASAAVLDFYGSQISIRSGRVLVPGGPSAEPAWKSLVGVSPEQTSSFVTHLLNRDGGWLAAYFDVLSRVDAREQQHLTQTPRFAQLYEAFRSAELKSRAASRTFRQGADLLVLDTRLQWEPNGDPHVPGSLEVWRPILDQYSNAHLVRDWQKQPHPIDRPDQLIESMVAFSRAETDAGPLQLYLSLCELDRRRPAGRQLSSEAVTLLARNFANFNHWYPIFSEFPSLSDTSMSRFISIAGGLEQVHGQNLRANAIGAFQANIGLWQILARQGEIPEASLDASWQATIDPFAKVATSAGLFDSALLSLNALLHAAGAAADSSPGQIINLLAGPVQATPDGQRIHNLIVTRMRAVLDDQQLVSLDTLFQLGDGLARMRTGKPAGGNGDLVSLATELRGFELPRPIFTRTEKASWAPGIYTAHHTELEVQTDLTKVLKNPGTPAQIEAARGQLAPFLRDTLVGLNYAYYEPPGAQILHINPLFVRAHDFLSTSIIGSNKIWEPPSLLGVGVSAGGGAYLNGSLVDLPLSLAMAEQDFIVPENVQALIWKELVPDFVIRATLPRWWDVSPLELHAVALYQRSGEELLQAATKDPRVRSEDLRILSTRMSPRRLEELEEALSHQGSLPAMIGRLMPGETFYLAEQYRKLSPEVAEAAGPAGKELAALALTSPVAVDHAHLARHFGVPHPTLAGTNTLELLDVPPFPISGGHTNRTFGESLESSNLYWGRLADEMGYAPVMLHLLVPELTRHMVGKIFGTNIEDWPAVMRAMQETGEDLRQGRIASLRKATTATPAVAQAVSVRQNPQEAR